MKKKLEKKYRDVVKKAAKIITQNSPEDAMSRLRLLPRKERRLIQRIVKKQDKNENNTSKS
jgi:fructose 1,6-bisphosphatase